MAKINLRALGAAACAVMTMVAVDLAAGRQSAPDTLTITLTGQSMLRSDLRASAPKAMPVMAGLLKGEVVFTNFEGAIARPGQRVSEGRGVLAPPAALDALKALGFNLLSLSNNHAFDLNTPFGGYKRSGNGREWSEFGFDEYLEIKGALGYSPA
jgi:hypothetical protein